MVCLPIWKFKRSPNFLSSRKFSIFSEHVFLHFDCLQKIQKFFAFFAKCCFHVCKKCKIFVFFTFFCKSFMMEIFANHYFETIHFKNNFFKNFFFVLIRSYDEEVCKNATCFITTNSHICSKRVNKFLQIYKTLIMKRKKVKGTVYVHFKDPFTIPLST